MAMIAGSVTVNDDEIHAGDGLALPRYEALKTARASWLPKPDDLDEPIETLKAKVTAAKEELAAASTDEAKRKAEGKVAALQSGVDSMVQMRATLVANRLGTLRGIAAEATATASADILYIQANAELVTDNLKAQVSTSTVLGRTPDPNDPNVEIQPPAAPVDLPTAAVGGAVRIQ